MAKFVTLDAFTTIASELSASKVRFLVVGGLAMHAHGFDRQTYDIDLVIQLDASNVMAAFAALQRASYVPMVPIRAEQFADAPTREGFRRDKNMIVLNFGSDRFRETRIDVFVAEPFDFDIEYSLGLRDHSLTGIDLCFPRAETLLAMKRLANRPKDQHDIAYLEALVGR